MENKEYAELQERYIRLLEENEVLRSGLVREECGRALIRQQDEFSLLLNVSRRIVSELDLQRVFDLVVDTARRLVGAELLIIPMISPGRDSYTYKAALGPEADSVLGATLPIRVGMCGWVLKNGRSLLFGQSSKYWLDEKTKWEEGQQSALLVPLFGRTEIIGGISALGKQGGGSFTHHDLDLLTVFAAQVSTAIENATLFAALTVEIEERKKAELEMAQALREKEVLLAEVHHRVKNNMAVISSLLQMQMMLVEEEHVRQMLKDCKQRVKSMSLVHERLYKSSNFCEIDLREYLSDLVLDLRNSYGRQEVGITLDLEVLTLSLNVLVPFGLVVNEVVSNSLKHAFAKVPNPEIFLSLKSEGGQAVLTITDNGPGFPSEEVLACKKTLGLKIIEALAGQMKASLDRSTDKGVRYTIRIPLERL